MPGANYPASKCQPPRAEAPRGRDFACARRDGPIVTVRRVVVFFAFASAISLTNFKKSVLETGERAMRTSIVAWCIGLALLVGGCDLTADYRYTRYGIGTDLYWDGFPTAVQLQDIYLSNICAQAITTSAKSIDPAVCGALSLTPRDWGLLVQEGMNDIDVRCDAYLTWLHDKKSSREPFLKELAVLGGATAAILKATEVGATPIALTAIAFGLAADTFTNADRRLLNGVDYTTVNSVVRGNRTEFRANNLNLVIDNRPAAVYVLRNYLSICAPASIEMSINNTINVFHRGGPAALQNTPIGLRNPVATSDTSAAIRGAPLRATQVIVKQGRPDLSVNPFAALFEENLSKAEAERTLNGLCFNKNFPTGRGDQTLASNLIRVYQEDAKRPVGSQLSKSDRETITKQKDCGEAQNYYEKKTFANTTSDQASKISAAALKAFVKLLNRSSAGGKIDADSSLSAARDKINAVRADPLLLGKFTFAVPEEFKTQVTPDMQGALRTLPENGGSK